MCGLTVTANSMVAANSSAAVVSPSSKRPAAAVDYIIAQEERIKALPIPTDRATMQLLTRDISYETTTYVIVYIPSPTYMHKKYYKTLLDVY